MFETAIISGMIIIAITVVGAIWRLADPRSDITSIKANYLSLREHEEFVSRFKADIQRLEADLRDEQRTSVHHSDLEAIRDRFVLIQHQLDLLIERSLVEPPPTAGRRTN